MSCYKPSTFESDGDKALTQEQLEIKRKIAKAEKLMRKRERKINRYIKRAKNEMEEEQLRREIIHHMSEKAKRHMEKRKAQWERERQKVSVDCSHHRNEEWMEEERNY